MFLFRMRKMKPVALSRDKFHKIMCIRFYLVRVKQVKTFLMHLIDKKLALKFRK